jgi:hypothetical protein
MEPEGSLLYSQEPATGSCPGPNELRWHPSTPFKMQFNITPPCMPRSPKLSLTSSDQKLLFIFHICRAYYVKSVQLWRWRLYVPPRLKLLVAGLSSRSSRFEPGSIHVGFVVDRVALGQVFLRDLRFSPVSIIPPSLSILVYHPGDEQYVR